MARLLVIEDDAAIAEALVAILTTAGHQVDHSVSGLDGLLRAARSRYDAVLADIHVDDLSGLGTARVIRDLGDAPVIVTSAARAGAWRREALAAGATACLPKPFSIDALLGLLESILRLERPPEGGWPADVRALAPADLRVAARLTPDEQDRLPFGAILVGADGRISAYNAYESGASGQAAGDVIGRPFSEVAPCTEVAEFTRAIEEGRARGELDRVLRFVFPHHRAACLVSVRLFFDRDHDATWIFVSKRRGAPGRELPPAGMPLERSREA